MDLNVKVAVRCRPMSQRELGRGCQAIITMDGPTAVSVLTPGDASAPPKTFTFDHCYYTDSTQEQVYADLGGPVVAQALEGFNGTIFAYGQTGSGKSWSMMGNEADPTHRGVIPRLNDDLWTQLRAKLAALNNDAAAAAAAAVAAGGGSDDPSTAAASAEPPSETKYLVTASFLEIYNEEIKDLLNPTTTNAAGGKQAKKLKIRESPEVGIYVEGLYELVVKSADDLLRLIQQGNNYRHVAATNMNEQSSRSHSCFTIKIEQKTTTALGGGMTREQTVKAKINLVDLAGSERADKTGATGAVLKEGANINKSLLTLGNVINALAEGAKGAKKHVPYRESELTRLLSESLGGNSATVMIAAVSPADYNFDETLSTLKYANRAKSIENAVKKNEDQNDRMIKDLKQEIERLKQQLAQGGGAGGAGGGGTADPEVERKLQEMEAAQRNAWDEKERLSRALEEERQANMNTVITQMMQGVKEQKVNHMKNIKKLTAEKAQLNDRFKTVKDSNGTLKAAIDAAMKRYQSLQAQYTTLGAALKANAEEDAVNKATLSEEEYARARTKTALVAVETGAQAEKIATEMADLLTRIEADRAAWMANRDALKGMKDRLGAVDEEITDERAELVATAGLLDQNDQLRAKIQAEEKDKLQSQMALELAAERQRLEDEYAAVRGTLEGEIAVEMDRLKGALTERERQLREAEVAVALAEARRDEMDALEQRLADALYDKDALQMRVDELQEQVDTLQHDRAAADAARQAAEEAALAQAVEAAEARGHAAAAAAAAAATTATAADGNDRHEEEMRYQLFAELMAAFETEREAWGQQERRQQQLLATATRDLLYLAQENERLRRDLQQAILYEPPVRPLRPIRGTPNGSGSD